MHAKLRQKYYSMTLIFVLLLSLMTPAATPFTVNAEETDMPISVADAIDLDNDGSEQTVQGHIVGHVTSGNVSDDPDKFSDDYNVAIADDGEVTDADQMVFVQVSGEFRTEFGLESNPENLGEEIVVTGDMAEYHGHYGVKDPNAMRFESEEPTDPGDLELKTISEVRDLGEGEVKTEGIVTAKLKNTLHIQDDNAAIAIYPVLSDVQIGDQVTVTGTLGEHNGLLQLQNADVKEKSEGVGPDPAELDGSQLNDHESELAVVKNVTLTEEEDGGDWANYTAEDADGTTFTVRDETNELDLKADGTYDSVAGIVTQFNGDYQIVPRSKSDVTADSSVVQPVTATPDGGKVPEGKEVTLQTPTNGADIYYTTDGKDPVENGKLYEQSITVDDEMTIKAYAEKEDLTTSDVSTFTYTVYDPEEGVQIHDIQGESHESSMVGDVVDDVEGIVTYEYDIKGSSYFHMQLPEDQYDGNEKTSEGIVVYTGKEEDVDVGDSVEVTGTVDEYFIDGYDDKEETDLPVTQINARDDQGGSIEVNESDVDLPDPIEITSSEIPDEINGEEGFDVFEPENYSIDFWESIEGMRVEVEPSHAIAPQEHGDLVVATNEFEPENETVNGGIRLSEDGPNAQSIQFKLQPNGPARDLKVKSGDKFTDPLTGVVNYGFGNYKVYTDLEDAEAAFEEGPTEPEQTKIVKNDDELTIASYNVENYSANSSAGETPDKKAENIARAFVDDMNSPDIIGIVEMMDNNGSDEGPQDADASESYERLISDIEDRDGPTYEYTDINPEYNQDGGKPSGNIRVGYLYNPERVDMTDAAAGEAINEVDYKDGELTLNPGRISPEDDVMQNTRKPLAAQFEFQGESVVVVANHLNSKTGDDPYYGQNQPPNFGSRDKREEMAEQINDFVTDVKQDNPDENIVVLGDMNDYEWSEPLDILAGDELTNKVYDVPAEDRYSYVYQGNSHVFDHMLVSNNIADATEIDMLHVNADFTDMHGRASDHDPVLTQIDLEGSEDQNQDEFELPIMHMNDTHAHADPLPKMYTAVQEYRADHPGSLLLNAGDVFSGTLYFNEFKGQADLELLNMMDLDAMVFGNHEFDLGDEEGGHESLSEFVENAEFPMLGTNTDFSEDPYMQDLQTNESLAEDANDGEIYNSIVKEVDGEEVGIFGLTTEDTEDIASPMDVEFENFKTAAEKAVDEFEDEGINKVVAVTHIGYDSAPEVGNDLRLAKEVDGIDVIIGGHSHTKVSPPDVITEDEDGEETPPTVIVQAGEYAENLGTLNVTFDDDGNVTDQTGELLEVDDYEADEDAAAALKEYKDQIEEVQNNEIGAEAMIDLENPRQGDDSNGIDEKDSVRANETELGNLVTDAMLAKAQEKYPETDISVQNGGGIRAPIDKGEITTGEVISVLPFGNDPVVATLTGQEIKDIMEHSVRQAPDENGGFLHVSGMKYYYDSTKEPGNRVQKMYLNNNGELAEINMDEEYQVTTNGFTGEGGDGHEVFADAYEDGRVKDIGETDWEQLRDYMVESEYLDGVVEPEREDRIVDLKGDEVPEIPGDEDNDQNSKPWIVDEGKPDSDLGNVGQLYLDSETGDVYVKSADGWEYKTNLQGPPGEDGATWLTGDGKPAASDGQIGDLYLNTETADVYVKSENGWEYKTNLKDDKGEQDDGDEPGSGDKPGDNNGKPVSGEKPSQDVTTPGDQTDDGEKLPVTATNMFVYLFIGIALFLAGVITVIYRRKRLTA